MNWNIHRKYGCRYRISAVTLIIKNMNKSCNFYRQIPGFKLVYDGSSNDSFTTFQIGRDETSGYLNLELVTNSAIGNFNKILIENILEE